MLLVSVMLVASSSLLVSLNTMFLTSVHVDSSFVCGFDLRVTVKRFVVLLVFFLVILVWA